MTLTDKELMNRLSKLRGVTLSEEGKRDIAEFVVRQRDQSTPPFKPKYARKFWALGGTAVAALLVTVGGLLSINGHLFGQVAGERGTQSISGNRVTPINGNESSVIAGSPTRDLSGVQMFSNEHGWMTGSQGELLHTVDGGQRWKVVNLGIAKNSVITAITDTQAVVAVPTMDPSQQGTVSVFRTNDGGSHWSKSTIPDDLPNDPAGQMPSTMAFSDSIHGWLVTRVPSSGMGGERPGALYRTIDGGATWQRVQATGFPSNIVAFNWLSFVTQNVGFTVGAKQNLGADSGVTDGSPDMLFVTRDGGVTWKRASITIPKSKFVSIFPPTMFKDGEGLLPVFVSHRLFLYKTYDGGKSWDHTGNHLFPNYETSDFVSPTEGFVVDGGTLYHTVDSGRNWEQISSAFRKGSGMMSFDLNFLTDANGWLRTAQNGASEAGPPIIWHSVDGGRTWSEVFTSRG
ncbi:WD40/YVTN/BNR-like repeat-containing protein [Alicyclobacillus dauci]|uniref:YCF48-related protein n=1 Tax=Alicyclobacillus dauci TaxID=1475485 RepID=A0ABY6Z7T1_9BACL|nr:YCF48-related protein [Alicyclobacillus dauci]WAH38075.1 YCF48-related protein [Alicyclobacillus dauci]